MTGMSVVEPKISAYRVALLRAFHQTEERPPVFVDPLALRVIGEKGRAELSDSPEKFRDRLSVGLRVSLAVRSRLAEEEFEAARARGVGQLVILGAGLDTYAYRRPPGGAERIFEVDLPGTQRMKRALLAAEGIAEPQGVVYAAADFERQTLREALAAAGFAFDAPAFFSWLGVAMYLEEAAVLDTLALIGALARGSGVVFDYPVDHALLTERERGAALHLMERLAARGEPWKCAFSPDGLREELSRRGFREIADFGPDELNSRYLSGREDGLKKGGVTRIARALA